MELPTKREIVRQSHIYCRRSINCRRKHGTPCLNDHRRKDFVRGSTENEQGYQLNQIGLQGLSEACDPRLSFARRLFWGILWFILLICCVTQLAINLSQYISNPTNVNIRYQRKKIMTSPCLTFCPLDDEGKLPAVWKPLLRKQFGNISYKSTTELLRKTGMDASTLWNMSRISFNNLTYRITSYSLAESFNTNTTTVQKTELNTVSGVCLTFKPLIAQPCNGKQAFLYVEGTGENPETRSNEYLKGGHFHCIDEAFWRNIHNILEETSLIRTCNYEVIIHSEAEIPVLRYYGPLVRAICVYFHKGIGATIRLVEETRVNSWNYPCISEAEHYQCMADCFERLMRLNSHPNKVCRLPFMRPDTLLPMCSSADEFEAMMLATEAAMDQIFDDDTHCKCLKPCNKITYKEDYFVMEEVRKLFYFYVPFPQCEVKEIKEEYSYSTANFISDIGGSLGLYMGMSILSLVAIVETFFSKLWWLVMYKSPASRIRMCKRVYRFKR